MSVSPARARDSLHETVARLETDVEASLSLARATLTALAALSPVLRRAAGSALAAESGAANVPAEVAARLNACRDQLLADAPRDRLAGTLEKALINAASALAAAEARKGAPPPAASRGS